MRILLACLLAAAMLAVTHPASAQNYPTRPVRIILPFGPGGVADVLTRVVAEKAGEKLGQRFVVENYPGAGGMNAARVALQAPADGYTLSYMASATAMSVNLFDRLAFDPVKDFTAVSSLGYFDLIFVAAKDSPYKSMADFIKAAKEKPGQLNVGTILAGSTQNLATEMFRSSLGLDFTIVPFRNSGEVLVALERNDVQLAPEFFPPLRAGLEAKKYVPLASSGARRAKYTPDVPTMKETGVDFEVTSWSGLFVRTGTPDEAIQKVNEALRTALADPAIVKRALDLGVEVSPSTPADLNQRMVAEIEKWRQVIDKAGIKREAKK